MAHERRDSKGISSETPPKFGADVYESAAKFNHRLATTGPAALYALSKTSEHIQYGNIVTGVGGMVLGGIGLFGNRYYRSKGDDTAYTYMGQLVGGVQFTAGFMLLALQATEVFANNGESSKWLTVIQMSAVAITVIEGTLVLFNSYLYGDGVPKSSSVMRTKLDFNAARAGEESSSRMQAD